jgi:hypothetical protein
MVVVDETSLCGFAIYSGMCAPFSEKRSLVISDNVLTNNVAGVHEMKRLEDQKPSTLLTIFGEAIDKEGCISMDSSRVLAFQIDSNRKW